ncbi:MAG: ABC transporter permease [Brevinematales bacterium]|nr:ABC transporter permease [Brevinematales bacterium]
MWRMLLFNIRKHWVMFSLLGVLVMILMFYLLVGLNVMFSLSQSLFFSSRESLVPDMIIVSAEKRSLDIFTLEGEQGFFPLPAGEKLLLFLDTNGLVEKAVPRIRKWAWVSSPRNEGYIVLTGVDPQREKAFFPERRLQRGVWWGSSQDLLLYYRHADFLAMEEKEEAGVGIMNTNGYIVYDTVRLAGLLDYGTMDVYAEFALYGFLPIETMRRLLGVDPEAMEEIWVRLHQPEKWKVLSQMIQKEFGSGYRIIPLKQASSLLSGVFQLIRVMMGSVMLVLLVLVYVCSSFLVRVFVNHRLKEVAIYHAMGIPQWRVVLLFGWEFLTVILFWGGIGYWSGYQVMKRLFSTPIEASLLPLQFLAGRNVLRFDFFPLSGWMAFFLFVCVIVSHLWLIGRFLHQLDPLDLLREV